MNLPLKPEPAGPDRNAAADALEVVRRWAATASPAEIAGLDPALATLLAPVQRNSSALARKYPEDFRPDEVYRASLPDLQNGPASLIVGARAPIQHVGISNFRLPIRYRTMAGGDVTLETSVTGTVSLEAEKKGINMSRIMRTFYAHAERSFSLDVMRAALADTIAHLGSFDARLQMRFSYPMRLPSLRSGLSGWQYYDIALELIEMGGKQKHVIHLDYVYSSTCPCSLELAEHARAERGQLATPHSQRSVARISAVTEGEGRLWFEELIHLARRAVPTETQVMVKREDEQAFAELNAAHPIFVEDAARSFAALLMAEPRIGDFRIMAAHQESLHSHDAVTILTEGPTFATESLDPRLFATLRQPG